MLETSCKGPCMIMCQSQSFCMYEVKKNEKRKRKMQKKLLLMTNIIDQVQEILGQRLTALLEIDCKNDKQLTNIKSLLGTAFLLESKDPMFPRAQKFEKFHKPGREPPSFQTWSCFP